MQNIHIEITGQVYKTGYRYFVKQMADLYHITGSISYLDENKVTIEAHGEEQKMEKFLSFCKMGNLGTQVHLIKCRPISYSSHQTFKIN